MMFFVPSQLIAQPPDPGGEPTHGDIPIGGSSPIGGGTFLLLAFGAIYGIKKAANFTLNDSLSNKNDEGEQ